VKSEERDVKKRRVARCKQDVKTKMCKQRCENNDMKQEVKTRYEKLKTSSECEKQKQNVKRFENG
jgi:hypothetical protein